MKTIEIEITTETLAKLEALASERGLTLNEFIKEVLDQYANR